MALTLSLDTNPLVNSSGEADIEYNIFCNIISFQN